METIVIYEAGVLKSDGLYTNFIKSPDKNEVEDYFESMKLYSNDGTTCVMYEKTYKLVETEVLKKEVAL